MDNFDYALQKTLRWEGGYQADKRDKGNYNSLGQLVGTNMGISAPALETHIGHPPTVEEMKALTPETAAEIYRQYWQAVKAGQIINPDLAALLFDMAVNHGPRSAVRIAQRAIGLKPDGKMGPVTLAALNRGKPVWFIELIIAERVNVYRALIARNASLKAFYSGWINRANSFLAE